MLNTFSQSGKQWVASFIAVDIAFWLLLLGRCAIDFGKSESCGEAVGFATVGFYAPFWFGLNWLDLHIENYAAQLAVIGVIGLACHACLGLIVGSVFRKHAPRWYVSIPVAFVCVMLVAALGQVVGYATGVYK